MIQLLSGMICIGGSKCVKADSDVKNMDDRKANPEYLSVIQEEYIKKLGEIKEVDFTNNAESVKNEINKKVEGVTCGKIKNLLSEVDQSTLVIALSENGLKISKYIQSRGTVPKIDR